MASGLCTYSVEVESSTEGALLAALHVGVAQPCTHGLQTDNKEVRHCKSLLFFSFLL